MSYYTPLHELGYTVDIVPPDRDFSKYKLVVAPALNVLTQAEADNLERYVKQGGHLVLGQRSAMKDEHNSRWPQRQPGPLASLLGARVEQYTAIDNLVDTSGVWGESKDQLFAEQLTAQANDVRVLMRYHTPHSWLDGQPAVVTRKIGNGSFTYVGVWLDQASMKRTVRWMLNEINLAPDVFAVPRGVDVCKRTGQDKEGEVKMYFTNGIWWWSAAINLNRCYSKSDFASIRPIRIGAWLLPTKQPSSWRSGPAVTSKPSTISRPAFMPSFANLRRLI